MSIIKKIEAAQVAKLAGDKKIPNFKAGDTLKVHVKIKDGDKVLGTASIDNIKSMYGVEIENSANKYIILTVFTHLEYQHQGIGKALIQKIDEYASNIGAEEVIIPASVYGLEFYKKLGYDFYKGNKNVKKRTFYN